jgi:hypothetical protein
MHKELSGPVNIIIKYLNLNAEKCAGTMIVFDLQCANNHRFEGWFESSSAFEEQKCRCLITCPMCGNSEVGRALSPVAVRNNKRKAPSEDSAEDKPASKYPNSEEIKAFYQFLDTHFENVGADFAKEALKIHYGVSEKKNIKGTSTSDEDELLRREGVNFIKVPVPRHDA